MSRDRITPAIRWQDEMRQVSPQIRRARLLAAREWKTWGYARWSILTGLWDVGSGVRKHMSERA